MKKTLLLVLSLCALLCGIITVDAKEANYENVYSTELVAYDGEVKLFKEGEKGSEKCNSLFGDPDDPNKKSLAFYLQWALEVMKYLGIILCIALTVVDFFKALLGEEKDAYKPLAKKALQRLIYAVCLFFTPIFVKVLLELIGVYGTCGIS